MERLRGEAFEQVAEADLRKIEEKHQSGEKIVIQAEEGGVLEFDAKQREKELLEEMNEVLDQIAQEFCPTLKPEELRMLRNKLGKEAAQGTPLVRGIAESLLERLPKEIPEVKQDDADSNELEDKWRGFLRKAGEALRTRFDYKKLYSIEGLDYDTALNRMLALDSLWRSRPLSGARSSLRCLSQEGLQRLGKDIEREEQQGNEGKKQEAGKEEFMEPQSWLCQEREEANKGIIREMAELEKKYGKEFIQGILINMFNPLLERSGKERFTLEDVKSVFFAAFESETASRVAGQEIIRPILLFEDIGEYQYFVTRIWGNGQMASRGMNIPRSAFPAGSPLAKTGLLLATPYKEFIEHEIRHSVDPYERKGWNRILEEAYGQYYDYVEKTKRLEGFQHLSDSEEGPWIQFIHCLQSKIYFESYASSAEQQISKEQYDQLVEAVVAGIRSLREAHSDIEVQRIILQSATLDDFFEKVKMSNPLKGGASKHISPK